MWTYKGRVAFVLSVLEKNKPLADSMKLQRLSQLMLDIMGGDLGIVNMHQVCWWLCLLKHRQPNVTQVLCTGACAAANAASLSKCQLLFQRCAPFAVRLP